jgi:hypothetical protein
MTACTLPKGNLLADNPETMEKLFAANPLLPFIPKKEIVKQTNRLLENNMVKMFQVSSNY